MKYELTLNDEFCDNVTRLTLIGLVELLDNEVRDLKARRKTLRDEGHDLPDYQLEDLKDSKRNRKSLLEAIDYISTPDQLVAFHAGRS